MDIAVLEFFMGSAKVEEFKDKKVLEVGSKYVNGSVRPFIEKWLQPKEYIGIDLEKGRYVDIVLRAEKLCEYFGFESFDAVIATSLLEHVQDWRCATKNIKQVLKKGGCLYVTTPSFGFAFHSFPYDFWRYEVNDMREIFSDFDILSLEKHQSYQTFLKAHKPIRYSPNDIANIALYSIVLGKRTTSIPTTSEMPLSRKLKLYLQQLRIARKVLPGKLLRVA